MPPRNYPLLARILTDVIADHPELEASMMRAAEALIRETQDAPVEAPSDLKGRIEVG